MFTWGSWQDGIYHLVIAWDRLEMELIELGAGCLRCSQVVVSWWLTVLKYERVGRELPDLKATSPISSDANPKPRLSWVVSKLVDDSVGYLCILFGHISILVSKDVKQHRFVCCVVRFEEAVFNIVYIIPVAESLGIVWRPDECGRQRLSKL